MAAFLFFAVFLAGATINIENSGGIASGKEAVKDVKAAFENPVKPDWSRLND